MAGRGGQRGRPGAGDRRGAGLPVHARPTTPTRSPPASSPRSGPASTSDPEKPLINRVIQGQYPPGSTFKIVNALAALQEGVITPQHAVPLPRLPGRLRHALPLPQGGGPRHGGPASRPSRSPATCTSTTWASAWRSSGSRRYAKMLGLAAPTGIDLPHEASRHLPGPGVEDAHAEGRAGSPRRRSPSPSARPWPVTPVQLARVAAVGGQRRAAGAAAPHEGDRRPGGRTRSPRWTWASSPRWWPRCARPWSPVVSEGTGQRAKLEGVAVGGKTGSAQVVTHARLEADKKARAYQPHGWFMCFAPAVNGKPAVAGAVLVEHGVQGGQSPRRPWRARPWPATTACAPSARA